jgi:MOSC domain-containing protein YiiM
MGKLLDIALRARPREPMRRLAEASVSVEAGIAGDARGRTRGRQLVVLGREGWEAACDALGERLPWTTRRANLLVEGVPLASTFGCRLRVGSVLLEITGECDPCHVMESARAGLRAALEPEWRAGVTCRVLEPGTLTPGAEVTLIHAPRGTGPASPPLR